MQLILSDKKESKLVDPTLNLLSSLLSCTDRDKLFYTAYEKSSLTSSVLPHLWTYRFRITLEHLYQTLQAQRMKHKCPILHEFLKEVSFSHQFCSTVWCVHSLSTHRSPSCGPHSIFLSWYSFRNRCLNSVIVGWTGRRQPV